MSDVAEVVVRGVLWPEVVRREPGMSSGEHLMLVRAYEAALGSIATGGGPGMGTGAKFMTIATSAVYYELVGFAVGAGTGFVVSCIPDFSVEQRNAILISAGLGAVIGCWYGVAVAASKI
jgi:hypothetical protein